MGPSALRHSKIYELNIEKGVVRKASSRKDFYLQYIDFLRCKQIIIADRKSAGDCFVLFDKLEFVTL